jgi:hypothetical protein
MIQFNQMLKNNKLLKLFLIFLFLSAVNIILYKILSPRVSAFGCFDDCLNYLGGYFMLHGKTLYSQIWFNHQPFMAFISFFIQAFTHPINIFDLLLKHRQFIMLAAFFMDALIIYRFGLAGIGFTLFYEFSKFYIFGDRFLGEGLIVYLMVYLLGLVWYKYSKREITKLDYILSAVFTWFIIFLREPYVLCAVFVYLVILFNKNDYKIKIISFATFSFLTIATILILPIKDYYFQVVEQNRIFFFSQTPRVNSFNIFKIFFYPIDLYLEGVWNLFRILILGLNTVFILLLALYFKPSKNLKLILILVLILGLANIRPVLPGLIFYSSFHLLPWFGMLIFVLFLMLKDLWKNNKKIPKIALGILILLFFYLTLSPNSYIHDKISPQDELINNYGNIIQIGEVARHLSNQNSTLFLDGADDLIYWQAKLLSPYKYAWYTAYMPLFPIYTNARTEMFNTNPPDFYYAFCNIKGIPQSFPPKTVLNQYEPLYSFGKPSCLYIKKAIIPQISAEQWKAAKDFKYELGAD